MTFIAILGFLALIGIFAIVVVCAIVYYFIALVVFKKVKEIANNMVASAPDGSNNTKSFLFKASCFCVPLIVYWCSFGPTVIVPTALTVAHIVAYYKA